MKTLGVRRWRRRPDEQQTPAGSVAHQDREERLGNQAFGKVMPDATISIISFEASFEALRSAWKRRAEGHSDREDPR